jgi:hypothetical protein
MKKWIKIIVLTILTMLLGLFCFFFVGKPTPAEEINWGVVFSQKHSELMGLNWKENYLAILDDLKAKQLHLIIYWDMVEKEKEQYDFSDMDWQIEEAGKRGAKITLVFGRKVPRWPECQIPQWAKELPQDEQNQELLSLIEQIIIRYRDNDAIQKWQVENEPFFSFGECPLPDKELLQKEINLVKSLDEQNRPVVITESGEFPLWFRAARTGDIVGHTLYKKVWVSELKMYFTYPFPSVFYNRKAWIIDKVFDKEVICTELQAEPWGPKLLYDSPLEEQGKTMNLEIFKEIIDFAGRTGHETFYLWGAEWWYWMKEVQNQPEIWNEARTLFKN